MNHVTTLDSIFKNSPDAVRKKKSIDNSITYLPKLNFSESRDQSALFDTQKNNLRPFELMQNKNMRQFGVAHEI